MAKQGFGPVQRRKAIHRSGLSLPAIAGRVIAGLAICLGLAAAGSRAFGAEELVRNPRFTPSPAADAPAQWSVWSPDWEPARCTIRATSDGLRIDAPGRPFAVGGVWQELSGVREKQAYAIEAVCQIENVASAFQSLHVRVEWLQGAKQLHPAGMLVRGPLVDKDLVRFEDVLVAPEGADAARLTLEVKWPRGGSILWKQVAMHETSPPAPRKVKIGAVHLRPSGSTPEKNLDLFCRQVDEAGRLGLDIVCLGEAITMVGTAKRAVDVAEPIPGPSTGRLGESARRNRLWVVAGLTERVDDRLYNTAVLLDRQGQVAGKYRKVHLPREEWKQGITPGDEYPVFRTDFGVVAIQICYDWFFPESHDIFALRGAEIVLAPTWGNTLPDKDGRADGETIFRARARDNGIYLVPSVYDGSSMVIDPLGRILASNKGREGVFWAEVDLNDRPCLDWVGYWRSIVPGDRMPSTYGPLLADPPRPAY